LKESSSREEICSTDSTFTLAAASSMASGMPSNTRHNRTTVGALLSVSSNVGTTALTRSRKSWIAS
jgi:hypothetical protein